MGRLFSRCAAAGSAALFLLACATVASAATPLQEYQRTGHITPCKYTAGQLGGKVPNDVEQYAPEYKSQLEAASRQLARGCGGRSSSGGGGSSAGGAGAGSGGGGPQPRPSTAAATPPRAAIPPAPPIDPTAGEAGTDVGQPVPVKSSNGGTSALLVVLLILGGLVVLGGAFALVARYLGWSPRWLAPATHAVREAGMRIATSAAGFADWARPSPRSS